MIGYPRVAVERAMKVQEVLLRAMAKKITRWQSAEILGINDRQGVVLAEDKARRGRLLY